MTLKGKIQSIAHSALKHPRHLAVAVAMTVAPGAALWGNQAASATTNGRHNPTTSQPEECYTGYEADPCESTTTVAPTTTTSTTTTQAPTTSTTTTQAPTTSTTSTTTTQAPPTTIPEDKCVVDGINLKDYYNDVFKVDPDNAFWKTRYYLVTEKGFTEEDAHQLLLCCDLEPPVVETTTTTQAPTTEPTTTTTELTTSTTEPTTTTSTTSTTAVISAPPSLPPMAVPAPPAAPAPQGPLAYTGGEGGLLATIGGTAVAVGVLAESKARRALKKNRGGDVAAGGPDPIDPDDLGFDATPLTGDAIDATDFDTLADDLLEAPKPLYVEGENRISEMVGYKSGGKNVPDALLPASLRLNETQTAPLVPVVAETVVVNNPFEGYKFAPQRYFDRGL